MDTKAIYLPLAQLAIDVGTKILGAVLLWILGRWVIGLVKRLLGKAMERRRLDITLVGYIESVTSVLMNVILALAVLGVFGVQTTTFAALVAAAGLAIGTAWGVFLQNFAAGAFLVLLKPFRRGDSVCIGGVTGVVEDISLLVVTLTTGDNVRAFVGNAKVFSDTIQNFSTNPTRRVDRTVQLAAGTDWKRAADVLRARVEKIPNVVAAPKVEIGIVDLTPMGPVLAVRPSCKNEHYSQVLYDTNAAIREELDGDDFPQPGASHRVQVHAISPS